MIHRLHPIFRRFMRPADDGSEGGASGGAVDRGDLLPSDEPDEKKPDAPAADAADDDAEDDPDAEEKASVDDADAEEEEDKEKDKAKKREQRIPLSRHKDLLEKERAKRQDVERQLAQFQKGSEVASLNEEITAAENKVIALEKEYATMLADGEVDKAAAKMAEIRTLERQMSEAKSDMKIAAAEARATERARYNIALERIESAYPQLNEDHDDFDADLMQDVIDLKASYEGRRGMTPTAAMQKAVEKLLGTRTKAQETAIDTTPRVPKDAAKAEPESKGTSKGDEVRAARKKEAVKTALGASAKQPPSSKDVGLDSDKAGGSLTPESVIKLGQAEFAKLPEEILSRMRGDTI